MLCFAFKFLYIVIKSRSIFLLFSHVHNYILIYMFSNKHFLEYSKASINQSISAVQLSLKMMHLSFK